MAGERRKRGTGSVRYHRPSGLWRAQFPKAADPTQRAEYFPTAALATRWLDGELERLARIAAGPTSNMPLREYLLAWLEAESASADWSPGTVDSILSHFGYLDALGDRPLASITRLDLQAIIADLVRNGGKGHARKDGTRVRRPLKGSYIALAVGYWRRALERAVEDDLIEKNPAKRLTLPPNDNRQRESWTPEEARKLASGLAGSPHEAILALILGCGLRIGEALALRWDAVDWQRQVVWIARTDSGRQRGVLERTKSRTKDDVPLIPPVLAALRRQRERQTWEAVYVSEWREGQRVSRDAVDDHLKVLAKRLGIRPLSPHAGRHAVGNLLGSSNVPLATISKRLRHQSTKTTADWYLATEDEGEQLASRLLETLFTSAEDAANG